MAARSSGTRTTAGPTTGPRTWSGGTARATPARRRSRQPAALPTRGRSTRRRGRRGHPEAGRRQLDLAHRHLSPDGDQNIKNLKLSLPAGAVGSLAAVPQCPLAQAQAGNCPRATRIGTVKNTVGIGDSLLTVPGCALPGRGAPARRRGLDRDRVPAKAGPIDLGHVVLINRVLLRQSDTGVDVFPPRSRRSSTACRCPSGGSRSRSTARASSSTRPAASRGPDGHLRRRRGRAVLLDHRRSNATQCDDAAVRPEAAPDRGRPGLTDQVDHPPLPAIVTQRPARPTSSTRRSCCPTSCGRTAQLQRAGWALHRRPGRHGRLPGEVAGRQRARDHPGAAVRAHRAGLHRPGDRQPAAEAVRAPARRRLRGAR